MMVFNKVPTGALAESKRVLVRGGKVVLTMPGAGAMRLPVVVRKVEVYQRLLEESGFKYEEQSIYPTEEVLNAKPGLRKAGNVPLALLFRCVK